MEIITQSYLRLKASAKETKKIISIMFRLKANQPYTKL